LPGGCSVLQHNDGSTVITVGLHAESVASGNTMTDGARLDDSSCFANGCE
jgi:hypothetical protein